MSETDTSRVSIGRGSDVEAAAQILVDRIGPDAADIVLADRCRRGHQPRRAVGALGYVRRTYGGTP